MSLMRVTTSSHRGLYKFGDGHEQLTTSVSKMNNSSDDIPAAAQIGSYRDALPTHFTFNIQSFSLVTATSMEKFESNAFEAGGYKWKIVFYPNGDPTEDGSENEHISMYLKIVETKSLPRGWIVDASFRFFVLDQIRDKYLILGDMGGRTRRFNEKKTMWGYSQLLPLTTLNDSSNRYLVDNACMFGAEVFPCKNTGCVDCLTMVESPSCVKYTWKIENFSSITEEIIGSDEFNAEENKWKIQVCPKGEAAENNEYFSLYLRLFGMRITDTAAGQLQVYARFKLRVRDQLHKKFHKELENKKWFVSADGWGFNFMSIGELNDQNKGYLMNDTCIVEAEVTVLGALKKLS